MPAIQLTEANCHPRYTVYIAILKTVACWRCFHLV